MKINYKKDGIELEDGTFISLEEINKKCTDVKIKEKDLVLLNIGWNGRGGEVFEQIVLPKDNALAVKDSMLGREVYFGEIWGKHSEVYGTIEESDFKLIEDKKVVDKFLKSNPEGHDYDHSFIYTFIESSKERLEYEEETEVTQEDIDYLQGLLKY